MELDLEKYAEVATSGENKPSRLAFNTFDFTLIAKNDFSLEDGTNVMRVPISIEF